MTFQAVVFDCDGVLVDSEGLAGAVERALLAEIGLIYGEVEHRARFMGLNAQAYHAALTGDSLERLGRPLPDDLPARAAEALWAACRERLTAVAGTSAFVSGLTLPKAVASSSDTAFLEEKLSLTGLLPLFGPHVYSADLVERGKPDPGVFLHAAAALKVAPAACLAIEDSVNGVLAAKAAGMTVWGFTGGAHMDNAAAAGLLAAGAQLVAPTWDYVALRMGVA